MPTSKFLQFCTLLQKQKTKKNRKKNRKMNKTLSLGEFKQENKIVNFIKLDPSHVPLVKSH